MYLQKQGAGLGGQRWAGESKLRDKRDAVDGCGRGLRRRSEETEPCHSTRKCGHV